MTRASYHTVNYALRPAKSVERKIMLEMLQGLRAFDLLSNYRYIGFGSIYFTDFSLFHRAMGICKMDSIEANAKDEERVRFNRPFNCIDIHLARSEQILQGLDWTSRAIVWLDYDHELGRYVLDDVDKVVSRARSGSVLFVTLDVEEKRLWNPKTVSEEEQSEWPENEDPHVRLARLVGVKNLSVAAQKMDIREGLAGVYRQILTDRLERCIGRMNIGRSHDALMRAQQFFYSTYRDGAEMMTIGWVLFVEAERGLVAQSGLLSHAFSSLGTDFHHIELPNLTIRELQALDRVFPIRQAAGVEASPIPVPDDDKAIFEQLYRYFPRFTETAL